jgi:signal transduction histidine kinase/ActR/RegA family two-component response regulator
MRVLLLLLTTRDSDITCAILEDNGLECHVCRDANDLREQLALGAGAILVGEELLKVDGVHAAIAQTLEVQGAWSDLPVLILTGRGADSLVVGDAVALLGNVTLLERPLRVSALLSALRTSLRARTRQYEIRDHLDALERARDAEADAVRRKNEFLAMLAHELRNPLAPIRNALHVLALDDGDAQRRHALHATMSRQVDHMVRLMDDLMEASRVSRGRIELRRRKIDLRHALRSALELSAPLVEAGGVTLQVDVPERPLTVDADPVRLTQVFGNLLNNAAKYGRPGGRIMVKASAVDDSAVVEILDDGIGIDPAVLPHVFELFTQGRRDRNRLQDGLGIGLALVKQLVELQGGRVEVHSAGHDKGTRVVVRLPCVADLSDAVEAENALSAAPRPLGRDAMRVLVVDDNEDAARTLALLLELLGMNFRIAADAPRALAVAADFEPHVCLLDIGLPGMNGYELARRLHADPRHASAVLIAITGWGGAQDQQQAYAAGFSDHFRKPADITRLSAVLEATRSNLVRRASAESSAA